jgi:poly-beta-1,6-N-acetyl-D-glucosamine biosynthesis protein PgaD
MKQKPSRWHRATEFTITTLFWLVWLYLVMPFLSLLMWAFGVSLFVEEMIVRGGYEALIGELLYYSMVMLAMLAMTLLWVYWNLRHYGAHEKRTQQPVPVSIDETAASTGLSPGKLQELHFTRRLRLTFDADDRIVIRTQGGNE